MRRIQQLSLDASYDGTDRIAIVPERVESYILKSLTFTLVASAAASSRIMFFKFVAGKVLTTWRWEFGGISAGFSTSIFAAGIIPFSVSPFGSPSAPIWYAAFPDQMIIDSQTVISMGCLASHAADTIINGNVMIELLD